MSSDTWLYWYWGKEGKVEDDIPRLEQLFRENNVTRILDLGCGTGRHTIYFASKGFQVFGFDQSEVAITRAKRLLSEQNLSGDLRVWNMNETPFPYENYFFDAVLAIRVIHHTDFNHIKKIANEISRITKRCGYLYLQVPAYEKILRLKQEGQRSEEIEQRTFIPLDGDESGVPHHYFRKEELLELFQEYNINDISLRKEHYCLIANKK